MIDVNNGARNPMTGELIEMQEYPTASFGNLDARAKLVKGGTMGDVYANHAMRTDMNGRIFVDPDTGNIEMRATDEVKLGSLLPKYTMGWSNNFSWKGIDLGLTFTARLGGIVLGGTQSELDRFGVSKRTAEARDRGGVKINNGYLDAEKYYSTIAGYAMYYTYDADNVRLSEMNLSYTLPQQWFRNKLRMTLGLTARNLWMVYCKAPFDPEMAPSTTNALYAGYDYFMQPSTRTLGFSVKLQF